MDRHGVRPVTAAHPPLLSVGKLKMAMGETNVVRFPKKLLRIRVVTEKQSEAGTIFGQDSFHKALREIFSGIDLCLAQHLFSPTLLLVFSCMDAFSWIELPAIQDRKVRFEAWVNKRMLPHEEVVCSAVDLYAARSGILHRLGTRSRLSESNAAAQISFCHGEARFEVLRGVQEVYSKETGKPMPIVKLEALADALRKGVDSFFKDVDSDPELKAQMEKYWEEEQAFRFPA